MLGRSILFITLPKQPRRIGAWDRLHANLLNLLPPNKANTFSAAYKYIQNLIIPAFGIDIVGGSVGPVDFFISKIDHKVLTKYEKNFYDLI